MSISITKNRFNIRSNKFLLNILLEDKTTGQNIKWATDIYSYLGNDFSSSNEISPCNIERFIQSRVDKNKHEQNYRTKEQAEVFTPSWSCNRQNNLIDEAWFNRKNIFNTECGNRWVTNPESISMPQGKSWKDYILANRMEISCGEAPYLTNRYDVTTGLSIKVNDRIGMLDRKLRIINENVDNPRTWFSWVKKAYKHIYGFDIQGDNVFLARENLLLTFIDNMEYKLKKLPSKRQIYDIARIISWNIWQMDGLTYSTPYSNAKSINQLSLFSQEDNNESLITKPLPSIIYDWDMHKIIVFKDLLRGE